VVENTIVLQRFERRHCLTKRSSAGLRYHVTSGVRSITLSDVFSFPRFTSPIGFGKSTTARVAGMERRE